MKRNNAVVTDIKKPVPQTAPKAVSFGVPTLLQPSPASRPVSPEPPKAVTPEPQKTVTPEPPKAEEPVAPKRERRGSFGGLSSLTKGLLENEKHISDQDKLIKEQAALLQKVDMAIAGLNSQIQRQEAHIKIQEVTLAKQQKAVDTSVSLIKELEAEIERIWLE